MPDYKSMYYKLFNRVNDAIELLKAAHMDGEDAFIEDNSVVVIELVENEKESKELK